MVRCGTSLCGMHILLVIADGKFDVLMLTGIHSLLLGNGSFVLKRDGMFGRKAVAGVEFWCWGGLTSAGLYVIIYLTAVKR